RMIVIGGRDGVRELNDAWAFLLPGSPASTMPGRTPARSSTLPDAAGPVFAVHGISPNPAVGDLVVDFSLPSAGPAELSLFDIRGALVRHADLGVFGAGRHIYRISARGGLPAGVYLVRIARGAEIRSIKAVVVR